MSVTNSPQVLNQELYIPQPVEAKLQDYFSLLKPRVMSLVIFTATSGLYLAPGKIHWLIAFIAILAISIAAGASGAINMWYDRDIDKLMQRTKNRAIPLKKILAEDALFMGIFLSIISVMLMGLAVNILSAALLIFTIFFYVYIYTILLKRSTPQNIVIGGAAGAFPPLIGWTSVTGEITIEPIILFLIIFFWTPPHFWALAINNSSDYEKANIPMLPVVKGIMATKKQILIYSILLFFVSMLPCYYGFFGAIYLYPLLVLNIIFLMLAIHLYFDKEHRFAKKLFTYSILYLFLLFLIAMLDKAIRSLYV